VDQQFVGGVLGLVGLVPRAIPSDVDAQYAPVDPEQDITGPVPTGPGEESPRRVVHHADPSQGAEPATRQTAEHGFRRGAGRKVDLGDRSERVGRSRHSPRHFVECPVSAVRAFDTSFALKSAEGARQGLGMRVKDPTESAERDPSMEALEGGEDPLVQPARGSRCRFVA